ncbi:hypothetical protein K502DRAFT_305142 [Neoconidiobolus thromboides FSU 785]|nr:hypothetical protein K502DRAFT_305142 [Neoconidiobolus thromboides FSU 785]
MKMFLNYFIHRNLQVIRISRCFLVSKRKVNLVTKDKELGNLLLQDVGKINAEQDPVDLDLPSSKLLQTVKKYQLDNKNQVALIRVGDFYEMYYDQAEQIGELLGLAVVKKKVKEHVFSFTGFPAKSLERQLEKLISHELDVAILEQYQDEITKQFYRKVDRIYTKGTLIDLPFLDTSKCNYLLSLYRKGNDISMSWLDVTTGEFFISSSKIENLLNDLAVIKPKEIILLEEETELIKLLKGYKLSFESKELFLNKKIKGIRKIQKEIKLYTKLEQKAANGIINYFDKVMGNKEIKFELNVNKKDEQTVKMDKSTIDSLEIFGGKNSVYNLLNKTITKGGSRLLYHYLSNPSTDISLIETRLNLIEVFIFNKIIINKIRQSLKKTKDAQYAIQKLSLNLGSFSELLDIYNMLQVAEELNKLLGEYKNQSIIKGLTKKLNFKSELLDITKNTLQINDMEVKINYESDKQLLNFQQQHEKLITQKEDLELNLRELLNCKSLKLVTFGNLAHIVEISSRDHNKFEDNKSELKSPPTLFQSLKGKYRYYVEDWSKLATEIEAINLDIMNREKVVLNDLIQKILKSKESIIEMSKTISEIDLSSTMAMLSDEYQLNRPKLVHDEQVKMMNCRHLTVEQSLLKKSKLFTNNDILLDSNQILVLTGPNMGGKSTFLRMVAINIILAQCGFFIPAENAVIGVTDAVYSRIGTGDNLTNEQSTFMIEMQEAGDILKKTSRKSLVIIDEIGRGTSPLEGEAIAYGILLELQNQIQCRTLFATHFQNLANNFQELGLNKCVNFHSEVIELENNSFTFLHKLKPGAASDSAALKTARLAGIPENALIEANSYLEKLNRNSLSGNQKLPPNNLVSKELSKVDLNALSPIEALLFLKKLKELL